MSIETFDLEIDKSVDKKLFDEIISRNIYLIASLSTYLLDVNKLINNNTETPVHVIEKLVYDIASAYCLELNIKIKDVFIEFWFKTDDCNSIKSMKHKLHLDCDEYDKIVNNNDNFDVPFLSSVTYLSNNYTSPTVITDIGKDRLYNKVNIFSFPKKYKSISFNGGKNYHGKCFMMKDHFIDNEFRQILTINLWFKKPSSVIYFDIKELEYKHAVRYVSKLKNIPFNAEDVIFKLIKNNKYTKTINDFSNETVALITLQEGSDSNTFKYYENIIRPFITEYSVFIFNKDDRKQDITPFCEATQMVTLNSIISDKEVSVLNEKRSNDVVEISNKEDIISNLRLIDINEDKFKQRFTFYKVLTKDACQWMIHESVSYANNNGGWMTRRHNEYSTTDLPIENINSVNKFIIKSFFNNNIRKKIINSYCINENSIFDITDAFIVKYEAGNNKQDSLAMHKDAACLSAFLLLNENTEFEGGGTFYEDNITVRLNIGDLVIHTKNHSHSGLKITKGLRYLLVFFINIYENKTPVNS